MKRIHIIRHAKSDWAESGLKDIDRPLNERGQRNAPEMALRLASRGAKTDFILCSPARRTRDTMAFFLQEFNVSTEPIRFEPRIYEAPWRNLVVALQDYPNDSNEAFFIGHNFGVSQLVEYLTEENLPMPTCAIATIDLYVDEWSHITANCGKLVYYDYPKKEIE